MRIFSTFSGIGGFEIGIQNAWRTHVQTLRGGQEATQGVDEERQGLHAISSETAIPTSRRNNEHIDARIDEGQPHCVGYSEIDKYAIKVYEYQFGGKCENCRLARERERNSGTSGRQETLDSERTRLSQAIGDNDNTKDERSKDNNECTCPKNYGDITKINAKELPDFDCLVGGFPCQAFSIAGKRRGFADTRGTLFFDLARIVKEKQPRLFVFENVKGLLSHDQGRTFATIIATIDELGYDCQWQVLNSKDFGVPQNRERIYIVGHLRGTPRPEVFPIGESNETPALDSKQRSGIRDGAVSNAIDANYYKGHDGKRQLIDNGIKIRRLTPLECERLQGFPDNWTAQGTDGAISDTQRYKMCGNAVTTNVVQAVFERIFESTTGVNQ